MFAKLAPEQQRRDSEQGLKSGGELLVARRDRPKLLEAIEQPLNLVALAVGRPIEVRIGALVLLGRDDRSNAAAAQFAPRGPTAIAFIPPMALGRGRPRPGRGTAPVSNNAGRARCSCRSPPVRTLVMGLPWRSQRRWIFVLKPPRLRPSAWGPLFSSPRRVLVGSNHAAIGKVQGPVQFPARIGGGLHGPEHALPNLGGFPAAKTAVHRRLLAVALRQVAPGHAGAEPPDNAIDQRAMIRVRPTAGRPFRGQQGRELLPLLVSEFMTKLHTPSLQNHDLCKHARSSS
jgi:hypothetical protein